MTLRRATVLVNRHAGSGRRLDEVTALVRNLTDLGWRVDVNDPGSAAVVAEAVTDAVARGADCIVVAGGDGSWSDVLQAHERLRTPSVTPHTDASHGGEIGRRSIPLALVPIGTGDDNARSLGMPSGDPIATAKLIDAGITRTIDLGLVESSQGKRWFSGVLSVGFDSQVNERANGYRRLPGTTRYLAAAAMELFRFTPGTYTITTSEGHHRLEAMLIAIGNGGYYGGGMAICPDFSLTDGNLEATVITELPRFRFVTTLPSVYSGRHVRQPEVLTMRSPWFTIEGDGQLVYADGERVGTLPIRVECVPHALTVVSA